MLCSSMPNFTFVSELRELIVRGKVFLSSKEIIHQLEREPMPNVMVTLPNIGGALCSMLQSLADALY